MILGRHKRRRKTLPKMTGKQNMKQECDFKIPEHNRNDEEHEQSKENTEIETKKNAEPENNKGNYPSQREEENEKYKEIITLESQSEDNKKRAEAATQRCF